jgi:hypothetical protein
VLERCFVVIPRRPDCTLGDGSAQDVKFRCWTWTGTPLGLGERDSENENEREAKVYRSRSGT